MAELKNIFQSIVPETGEVFDALLERKNVRIERITSSDILPDREYVQEQDEWVLLLRGSADLTVNGEPVSLAPGDYLFIGSRTPHRVLRAEKGSVWLGIHIH